MLFVVFCLEAYIIFVYIVQTIKKSLKAPETGLSQSYVIMVVQDFFLVCTFPLVICI